MDAIEKDHWSRNQGFEIWFCWGHLELCPTVVWLWARSFGVKLSCTNNAMVYNHRSNNGSCASRVYKCEFRPILLILTSNSRPFSLQGFQNTVFNHEDSSCCFSSHFLRRRWWEQLTFWFYNIERFLLSGLRSLKTQSQCVHECVSKSIIGYRSIWPRVDVSFLFFVTYEFLFFQIDKRGTNWTQQRKRYH